MWIELTDLADESSLVDGEDYARRGRVEIVSVAVGEVHAVVHGSSAYDVLLHTNDWSCTCPTGADGQFCKHLVATALVASGETGGDQDDRLGTRAAQLDAITSWLASLDEPALREVLEEVGRRHPAAMKALAVLLRSRTPGNLPVGGPATTAPSVARITKPDDR